MKTAILFLTVVTAASPQRPYYNTGGFGNVQGRPVRPSNPIYFPGASAGGHGGHIQGGGHHGSGGLGGVHQGSGGLGGVHQGSGGLGGVHQGSGGFGGVHQGSGGLGGVHQGSGGLGGVNQGSGGFARQCYSGQSPIASDAPFLSAPEGPAIGEGTGQLDLSQCAEYADKDLVHVFRRKTQTQYHFSWCAINQKFTWQAAQDYCHKLGFQAVSINNQRENRFIVNIIEKHRLPYLWTSGQNLGTPASPNFRWTTGRPFSFTDWGKTGQIGCRQPDDAEEGITEKCVAFLNHFYGGDTTTWHDIGCHHTKPVICERYVGPYDG